LNQKGKPANRRAHIQIGVLLRLI